jgi:hypothetical protein
MRGSFAVAALVCGLSIGLVACEGAARGGCASPEDVAVKMTALTDALNKAQTAGKIDAMTAGQIAARIMEAGAKHGGDHRAYCGALEEIRTDAKL